MFYLYARNWGIAYCQQGRYVRQNNAPLSQRGYCSQIFSNLMQTPQSSLTNVRCLPLWWVHFVNANGRRRCIVTSFLIGWAQRNQISDNCSMWWETDISKSFWFTNTIKPGISGHRISGNLAIRCIWIWEDVFHYIVTSLVECYEMVLAIIMSVPENVWDECYCTCFRYLHQCYWGY